MENFTPVSSLLGGMLIGLSAALVLLGLGRIAGISGIFGGLLVPRAGDIGWRATFVAGLLAGGLVMSLLRPELFAITTGRSLFAVAIAGLFVGVGTRMGNGCTSGHGVCGISRGSPRSLAATMVFMATGILTVFLVQHVFGGNP
jgi:uncharacterized membrane protein YedE/YeeE